MTYTISAETGILLALHPGPVKSIEGIGRLLIQWTDGEIALSQSALQITISKMQKEGFIKSTKTGTAINAVKSYELTETGMILANKAKSTLYMLVMEGQVVS